MPRRYALTLASMLIALTTITTTGCDSNATLDGLLTAEMPTQQSDGASETAPTNPSNAWDLILLQGTPIGFSHTEIHQDERTKTETWEQTTELSIKRFGQPVRQTMRVRGEADANNHFYRGSWQTQTDENKPSPPGTAQVADDGKSLAITPEGGRETIRREWHPSHGGFFAVERSLRARPMKPGETRSLKGLLPVMNQLASFELVATERETIEVPVGSLSLLRIKNEVTLVNESAMHMTLWVDNCGQVLKQTFHELDQTIVRTDELNARSAVSGAFDLGQLATVKLSHNLETTPDLHAKDLSATYRVRRKPTRVPHIAATATPFLSDERQTVTISNDSGNSEASTVLIEVTPRDIVGSAPPVAALAREAALKSSRLISADDDEIVKLADNAAKAADDSPLATAKQLERFVHEYITDKDYSQLLLGASQVARQRRGDCTEHAVLLAALCRAKGIPARVAIGLVYVPANEGFVFHMWNECLIDDHWIDLDATLGAGGIGAGHLKVKRSNLSDENALSDFLPVAQLVGQIEIEWVTDE